jgi:ubiquinone/menaquinone biosynthesis C-methylase UbiE
VLLRAAGIGPGMRVLDLGTGLGHVSLLLAELVGPAGEVVAIDQDPRMLDHAERRRAAAGVANIRFIEANVRSYRDAEPFDAVVGRLVLFHLPDAVAVVRHHLGGLRLGGIFAAVDFDVGAARCEPPVPLLATLVSWISRGLPRGSRRSDDRHEARAAAHRGRGRRGDRLRRPGLSGA